MRIFIINTIMRRTDIFQSLIQMIHNNNLFSINNTIIGNNNSISYSITEIRIFNINRLTRNNFRNSHNSKSNFISNKYIVRQNTISFSNSSHIESLRLTFSQINNPCNSISSFIKSILTSSFNKFKTFT